DISLINTPPVDRLPIRTYISQYDDALIQKAIEFELARGGQVFYLHNRVQTIRKTAKHLSELVPSAQVIVAHGQMPEHELEETMLAFYQKQANVLVCTTLIESGLDLPSANTIIIDRADSLGLAQLYQIRGRVGRGQVRAYAYLLIPAQGTLSTISEDARRRLEVIQRFVELGSGFSIASHDLEIRGGGDLLGAQQSGNINAVGFDLYTELLEEAILEIQGLPPTQDTHSDPEIKAPFPCYLSEEYVPDVHQRLSLYRRFSAISQENSIEELEIEMRDRFGTPPVEAHNLLWLIRIKILLKKVGIEALTVGPEKVSLTPGRQNKFNPTRVIALVSSLSHQYQLMPDSRLVAKIPTANLRDLYFGLETLFRDFS
ncbi:MAG: TRCF domain-containing protein, partial [Bdellovibrionia bacterium]